MPATLLLFTVDPDEECFHFTSCVLVSGPACRGNAFTENPSRFPDVTRLMKQRTELLVSGDVLGLPHRGILKSDGVMYEDILRIVLKKSEKRIKVGGVHNPSISFASAISLSVNPPALCVESVSVTLFHRMSISG